MGVFDKFLDIMKLNDDEYDDDDFTMMILKMMISMKNRIVQFRKQEEQK